jgi:hypothetical protein
VTKETGLGVSPPPIGLRRGDQRKKREGGAGRGEKVKSQADLLPPPWRLPAGACETIRGGVGQISRHLALGPRGFSPAINPCFFVFFPRVQLAEIINKSRSLKGTLEPFSTNGNLDMLRRAGFVDIMTVIKYVPFEGFLAIK